MPRLSLFKPEKGQDYSFIDRQISEMFQIGATELYLHKYIGTGEGDNFKDVTQIQDLVFLENRDRKYDKDIYKVRGHYNVANIDFNLSQFGLFIDNDTVFLTVHINDWIKLVGRKPLSGDVLEFPHLRDDFALNDYEVALPRYYVIEDVGRASEGFSQTWWPHLYRLKLKKITDSQQFADLLNSKLLLADGSESAVTVGEALSTRSVELGINDAILAEAEANAAKSGYETQQFYTLAVDQNTGRPLLRTVDVDDTDPAISTLLDASSTELNASDIASRPKRSGYTGYLLGDGIAPNGAYFGHGISFPNNPTNDDFFLRTDFLPNRLFRFDGIMWIKVEDSVRMTMTNEDPTKPIDPITNPTRQTQKTSFINNSNITGSVQIGFDVYVCDNTNRSSVQTNKPYVPGMVATVFYNDVKRNGIVTLGTSGNALITFQPEPAVVGDTIQWKLFTESVPERQSLSKALKPKADL
jgi:hypothetical protein